MSSEDKKHRSHLPIPTPERTGLITYDAWDPDTKRLEECALMNGNRRFRHRQAGDPRLPTVIGLSSDCHRGLGALKFVASERQEPDDRPITPSIRGISAERSSDQRAALEAPLEEG
jgi:hypothetical protein